MKWNVDHPYTKSRACNDVYIVGNAEVQVGIVFERIDRVGEGYKQKGGMRFLKCSLYFLQTVYS